MSVRSFDLRDFLEPLRLPSKGECSVYYANEPMYMFTGMLTPFLFAISMGLFLLTITQTIWREKVTNLRLVVWSSYAFLASLLAVFVGVGGSFYYQLFQQAIELPFLTFVLASVLMAISVVLYILGITARVKPGNRSQSSYSTSNSTATKTPSEPSPSANPADEKEPWDF
ncbi:MAG: hypothetical protein R3C03_01195 [Pirellulaceae bacterium]